jgi:signal transduction histidine kinase
MSDSNKPEQHLAPRSSLPLGLSSLSSRVFWSVIPVILILSIIIGAANVYEYRRLITEEFMKRGASMASNLAYSSQLGVFSEDQQLLEASLRGVLRDPDTAYVAIYGDRGKLLAWRKLGSSSGEDHGLSPEEEVRLAAEQKAFLNASASIGNDLIEFLAPVLSEASESSDQALLAGVGNNVGRPVPGQVTGDVHLGAIRLGLSLGSLNEQTKTLIAIWTFLTAAMLLLSAMAIYTLSRRVTMPVMRLTEQAKAIAHGVLDQVIEIRSADEIGQLAASFNQMVHSLKTTSGQKEHVFRELQELNRTLEDRIRERTVELEARGAELLSQAREAREQTERASQAAAEAVVVGKQKELLLVHLRALLSQRELMIRALHHDANQPLFVVGGQLFVMEQIASANRLIELFRQPLSKVSTAVKELDALLRGIHEFVTLGEFVPKYEPVSVNELLSKQQERFAEDANIKGIELVVRIRKEDVLVWTDANAIDRMIGNLISNAIKYTVRGRVFVGTVRHGNLLRVDVLDSGVGIPRDKRDEIYKEFIRLNQEGVGDVKGLGLGLAIVKLFRDHLGGHYVEHNSDIGRGSRFSVSIPISGSVPDINPVTQDVLLPMARDRIYVVIVEDNNKVRETMVAVMWAAGYNVQENVKACRSLSDLRALFDQMPYRAPNVVVTDFRLLDGETANDVIDVVDQRFDWETVPIFICSAEVQPNVARKRPHVHIFAKSGDPSQLLASIEDAILKAHDEDSSTSQTTPGSRTAAL